MRQPVPQDLASVPCSYRVELADDVLSYCRHSGVRATNHLVSPVVCQQCTVRGTSCETPRLLVPEGLTRLELRRRLRRFRPVRPLTPSPAAVRERLSELVTIGITAFRRPQALSRLVASIREFYPTVQIVIADNGDDHCQFQGERIEYLQLPFDCGLSASRNVLAENFQTPYLLILEDDFEFTAQTQLERFVDVLQHDSTLGVVGGCLWTNGERLDFAADLDVFRERLSTTPPVRPLQRTQHGTTFQVVDLIFNFALFRREMLREQCWDEELKLAEHVEYFLAVSREARWRVAICREVSCLHHQERGTDYDEYRLRQELPDYTELWKKKHGLQRVCVPRAKKLTKAITRAQNVVLFGVGHSGTSIVTQLLLQLGWAGGREAEDVDPRYSEHIAIRQLNIELLHGQAFNEHEALRELRRLPSPWVIKDPRFVHTLPQWLPVFAQFQPTLLWLVRDIDSVKDSYRRRQSTPLPEPRSRGHTIPEVFAMAQSAFAAWPWSKLRIDFEDIIAAVDAFDVRRARRQVSPVDV